MRVVCERVESATTGEQLSASPWLTIGRQYVVLEIEAGPGGEVDLRLLDDQGLGPGLHAARLFRTTSHAIPSIWTAVVGPSGTLTLAPRAWQRPGFWEDYFDGNPEAIRDYEEAKQALLAEEEVGDNESESRPQTR